MATRAVGFDFVFDEPGGRDHLLPGRPLEQTRSIEIPANMGAMVSIAGFTGSFVTDGGVHLTERPLGQFSVQASFRGRNTVVCQVRLTDSNMDDAVRIHVRCVVLMFS